MPRPRPPIAFPSPHFMAFAPLDVWARLLLAPRAWVPPRYWLRLAFALFTSCIGTILTLPERLTLGSYLRLRAGRAGGKGPRLEHGPGVVVVLGYFRSGTTHLHYLLSCDPRFRSPRWCETLAPHGFLMAWAFLRVFMIPFLSATRPQDDVAIGPEWPAEDDFALCNASLASSLPGRFVVPRNHRYYDRFHSLEGLSRREHYRWRFAQWAFCWKLGLIAGRRAILLKTPSHTARVSDLLDLFGPGRVKFVHISRDPEAVLRSNVSMADRLAIYNLQDPPPADDIQARLLQEYVETERKYLGEAAEIPPGDLAQIRYEDLIADPLGELRRLYQDLGVEWTDRFERRVTSYLDSVRDYTPATRPSSRTPAPTDPALGELARTFDHHRPTRAKVPLPTKPKPQPRGRSAYAIAAGVALVCAVVWISQAWLLRDRHDWLAWPTGIAIGLAAIRARGVGTVGLGVWAALLTALTFLAVSVPGTFLSDYAQRPEYRDLAIRDWEWDHILKSSRVGLTATNNLFWLFMGVVTAYRFASRTLVRPPGV